MSTEDAGANGAELAELRTQLAQRQEELDELNRELAETNLGVVALYSELEDKAAQLKEASELKSRFLSYMSHEFKTPLSSIRSIARLLLDRMDGPLLDEQEKQVRFVDDAARELTDMVNDLLDLARVEAGRVAISAEWFEMLDLFSTLRGMFKPLLMQDAVSLVFEEPGDLPRIYSDDKKISQILRNFISNALKFTPAGEVRVSCVLVDDERIRFAVSDTGIGIAAEHLGALFQDFVQLQSPLQKRLRGTGLGLSLSKRLAELLGGSVDVSSELGKGSTFLVTLPLRYAGSMEEADG